MDIDGRKTVAEIRELAVKEVTRDFSEQYHHRVGGSFAYAWDGVEGDEGFALIKDDLERALEGLSAFPYSVSVWGMVPDLLRIKRVQVLISPKHNITGWENAPR